MEFDFFIFLVKKNTEYCFYSIIALFYLNDVILMSLFLTLNIYCTLLCFYS